MLKASLERFGQVRSLVCQLNQDGTYTILAGHGIVQAAQELVDANVSYQERFGKLRADLVPTSWDSVACTAYLIADNNHAQYATDDEELLATLLQEQSDAGFDLATLGTDDEELRQMLESMGDEMLDSDEHSRTTELDEPKGGNVESAYNLLIMCDSEIEQQRAYDLATKEGFNCKVLTL